MHEKKFYFWRTFSTQILAGSCLLIIAGWVFSYFPSNTSVDRQVSYIAEKLPDIRKEITVGDDGVKKELRSETAIKNAERDGEINLLAAEMKTLALEVKTVRDTVDVRFDRLERLITGKKPDKPIASQYPRSPSWFIINHAGGT